MFGQYFYNKHLRNTVIAFGTIFNTIGVRYGCVFPSLESL